MASLLSHLSTEARSYLLHHVFLFPQLPQEDDYNAAHELLLIESVIKALKSFKVHVAKQHDEILRVLITILVSLRTTLGSRGEIDDLKLKSVLRTLDTDGKFVFFSFESSHYLVFRFQGVLCPSTSTSRMPVF